MDKLFPSLLQRVETAQGPAFDVLRLDKLHPVVSGNKSFKLKYHLEQALQTPGRAILTFGGAWSNHLVATAYAASQAGLRAIGVIRGERPPALSATLKDAESYGMSLHFLSRAEYAQKEQPHFLQQLTEQYPGAYIIPEGGGGKAGIQGSQEILRGINSKLYTHICCAIGTGTTFLGLVLASAPDQQMIGVPVLKGIEKIEDIDPDNILTKQQKNRCQLFTDYHFGGYARHPQELLDFMNQFYQQTLIPTDIVYTGKLFYAICKHPFPNGSRLLVVHSGGLQGNLSLPVGALDFN